MKKVILSFSVMLLLMSFTKSSNIQNKEELFSPECFEYADTWTSWKNDCVPFANDLAEFDYWQQQYDDCEGVTDNDAFQFPDL